MFIGVMKRKHWLEKGYGSTTNWISKFVDFANKTRIENSKKNVPMEYDQCIHNVEKTTTISTDPVFI